MLTRDTINLILRYIDHHYDCPRAMMDCEIDEDGDLSWGDTAVIGAECTCGLDATLERISKMLIDESREGE